MAPRGQGRVRLGMGPHGMGEGLGGYGPEAGWQRNTKHFSSDFLTAAESKGCWKGCVWWRGKRWQGFEDRGESVTWHRGGGTRV